MPLPIISVAQMRDWEERTWEGGVSQKSVMTNAGLAVAQSALAMTPEGGGVLLVAGKGNNGGDTRIAAANLPGRLQVLVDAKDAVSAHREFKHALDQRPDLIVDGLFGVGLDRNLDEDHCDLVQAMNEAEIPILSIDCPSGLNADTGEIMGASIMAKQTITLGSPKFGLLQPCAYDFVGALEVADSIGLSGAPPISEQLWLTSADMFGMPPERMPAGHKGVYGHLGIIAGSTGYHGAACLCARAAFRARPGLVSVFTPVYQTIASHLQSAMVHPWSNDVAELMGACTAMVIGPGLAGPDVPGNLRTLACEMWCESQMPIIGDACALDWLPHGKTPDNSIRVLTPHPGEAARMLKCKPGEIQQDRLAATRELAKNYDATIVLKGRHTIIGQADGPVLVNPTGNSGLGQGGSGDVLAGFVGGVLANPQFRERSVQAIAYAVWQHGKTADQLAVDGNYWGMEDLIDALGNRVFC